MLPLLVLNPLSSASQPATLEVQVSEDLVPLGKEVSVVVKAKVGNEPLGNALITFDGIVTRLDEEGAFRTSLVKSYPSSMTVEAKLIEPAIPSSLVRTAITWTDVNIAIGHCAVIGEGVIITALVEWAHNSTPIRGAVARLKEFGYEAVSDPKGAIVFRIPSSALPIDLPRDVPFDVNASGITKSGDVRVFPVTLSDISMAGDQGSVKVRVNLLSNETGPANTLIRLTLGDQVKDVLTNEEGMAETEFGGRLGAMKATAKVIGSEGFVAYCPSEKILEDNLNVSIAVEGNKLTLSNTAKHLSLSGKLSSLLGEMELSSQEVSLAPLEESVIGISLPTGEHEVTAIFQVGNVKLNELQFTANVPEFPLRTYLTYSIVLIAVIGAVVIAKFSFTRKSERKKRETSGEKRAEKYLKRTLRRPK